MKKEYLPKVYVAPECEALQFELEQNILNNSTNALPDMDGENWGFS